MHVVAVQFDIAWEDRAANHARVAAMLDRESPPPRDSLVVLPEMFASGFSMNVDETAQDETRADERFVAALCRRWGAWCVAGVTGRGASAGMGRNEAVVIAPDGTLVARYCKMHPFSPAGEDRCFEAGREVVTFDCHGFTVAPTICYDLRFPELFRLATRRGANLFLVIANWPDARAEQRLILLRARAIENQAYVVGVNRVGNDPGHHYAGQSVVIHPRGDVVAQAGEGEQLLRADLDLGAVHDYRASFPWLRDVRDDLLPR
jgi:predicted amidohydrolase